MNADERFARVRVRRSLLPLMQTFNGRIVEALSRSAQLLREDAAALEVAAAALLTKACRQASESAPSDVTSAPPLDVDVLKGAPVALRRRALRRWLAGGRGDLRRLEMTHLQAVESLLEGARGGRTVELPGGAVVRRKRGRLYFDLKRVEKGEAGV